MKVRVVNTNDIMSSLRFDGKFHNAEMNVYDHIINSHSHYNLSHYCEDIFTSGRNKRLYTLKEYGYPFLSNTETVAANPFLTCKYSSKKYNYDEGAFLKKGMILTGRVGAIGQTAFVLGCLEKANAIGSDNIIRISVKPEYKNGFIYAYLASKIGYLSFWKHATGGVQPFITDKMVGDLPIPDFSENMQQEIDDLIKKSADLREEAIYDLNMADKLLKEKAGLEELTCDYYDYYGHRSNNREVSCYVRNIREVGSTSINAFNHSERIRRMKSTFQCRTKPLKFFLNGGDTFSTGSFPRIEVKDGHGIMLINQKDIFDNIIKGKYISKRGVKSDNLVEYGEVLIAGVGTLGENETFCRTVFANEDLTGQLISGEFIRMKTTEEMPSGYLYAWLSSDFGFRLLRNLQAGTKLCRPIPKLVLELPIPIIDKEDMFKIDSLVREAHTKRHQANQMELKAIRMVEEEIEKWNN